LNYALFQPSGVGTTATCDSTGGTEWTTGAGAFNAGAAPSNAARTIKVCGRLPAGQDVRAASYRDLVDVTITF
jgi:spore coat protein U-like protein